jgi:hypothetical protein
MAALYITEYQDILRINGVVQVPVEPAIAEQKVTFTTTTQSSAFNASTRYVRIHTDAICSIKFGLNPTAVVTEKRMAADSTEYFAVSTGHKVAAVTNT